MKILFAVDNQPYSASSVSEVAKIAANTWADVTLLTVQPGKSEPEREKVATLREYKKTFLKHISEDGFPYAMPSGTEEFTQTEDGWLGKQSNRNGSKSLTIKIRRGNALKEITQEALSQESDLIIIAGSPDDCQWQGEILNLPQRVAEGASCSVLVIKETRFAKTLIGCLDQSQISQESLEMINQLVTYHQADLKIIGLTGPKGLSGKGDVEGKMGDILSYYNARNIKAWITLVENTNLEEYISKASKEGIIAVWMGKKSIFRKLFSENLVEKLISSSQSSVLILR
jgi:nucleotide-binding universal stress UspA family protein